MESVMNFEDYIKELELDRHIDPNCDYCKNIFYPQIRKGKTFSDIQAPRHKPSVRCESGKHPHCTCDTCF